MRYPSSTPMAFEHTHTHAYVAALKAIESKQGWALPPLLRLRIVCLFMLQTTGKVAQQEAERARFVVMKNEQEREASIIRAEGEAEAAKLISQALAAQGICHPSIRQSIPKISIIAMCVSLSLLV